MSLNDTPRASRLHIGIFGKTNTGKSSIINALTNQSLSVISNVAGTTTDPVYKSMEIHGLGPCVIIDTAGFDDDSELGKLRIEQTKKALAKTDIAVFVFSDIPSREELNWIATIKQNNITVIPVINKTDIIGNTSEIENEVKKLFNKTAVKVSATEGTGFEELKKELIRCMPEDFDLREITNGLVSENDVVLLVMPQDIQAPKGRLILPQVQTLRELLDKKCIAISVTTDKLDIALNSLSKPPKLIITDSQVFKFVYDHKPKESLLTSFSVLFSGYKGDIEYFIQGANSLKNLNEDSNILIAEACTHAPLNEDIGREKLPRMLRKHLGEGLKITNVNGNDFPADLTAYDLIIQCGSCMFGRSHVMSRVRTAKEQGVPMSNYGIVIAFLSGILDKITVKPPQKQG